MRLLVSAFLIACMAIGAHAETVSPALAKVLANVSLKMKTRNWDGAIKSMMDYGGERIPIWHNTIGQVYLAKGDTRSAVKHLKRALDKHKKPSYALDLAQAYAGMKEYEKAKTLFAQYATPEVSTASHWERYVQVTQLTQDDRLLGELLAAGLIRFPDSRYLRQIDARFQIRQGNVKEAMQALDYMIRKEPTQYHWWLSRHSLREQQAEVDGVASLADLEMAAKLAPDNASLRHRLVHVYHREGLMDQAWALAQRIMADTKAVPADVVIGCAQLAIEKGRSVIATSWLKTIAKEKQNTRYHSVACQLALEAGDKTAIGTHLNALSVSANPPIHFWLRAGQWANAHNHHSEAESWYLTAQQLDKDHQYKAALHLAQYRIGQGKLPAAKALIEAYLQAQPQDQAARAMLSLVE